MSSRIDDIFAGNNPNGMWSMWCFSAFTDEQQRLLVEEGYLPVGLKAPQAKDRCDKPAAVELTTDHDQFPGPRFYCTSCAIKRLAELQKEHES